MMHLPSYNAGKRVRTIIQRAMVSAGYLLAGYLLYVGIWILHNGK